MHSEHANSSFQRIDKKGNRPYVNDRCVFKLARGETEYQLAILLLRHDCTKVEMGDYGGGATNNKDPGF